jgi:lipopolysaccharide export system protein LptC
MFGIPLEAVVTVISIGLALWLIGWLLVRNNENIVSGNDALDDAVGYDQEDD